MGNHSQMDVCVCSFFGNPLFWLSRQTKEQLTFSGGPKPFVTHGHGSKPMVPFCDRCTTHFRTYFSGWIESDVRWLTDLGFDNPRT